MLASVWVTRTYFPLTSVQYERGMETCAVGLYHQVSIWYYDSETELPLVSETRFGDNAITGDASAELLFFADLNQEKKLTFWSKGVELGSKGSLVNEAITVLDIEAANADIDSGRGGCWCRASRGPRRGGGVRRDGPSFPGPWRSRSPSGRRR